MRVDHRGENVGVIQQLLHSANGGTRLQQMVGKRMTQGMRRGWLQNQCRLNRLLERTLKCLVIGVVPAHFFAARVNRYGGLRKHPMTVPCLPRLGVFGIQGIRHLYTG